MINKNNNINCLILNKITPYINITNKLNIIYSIDLHNLDINTNNTSNTNNTITNDKNEEENNNKLIKYKTINYIKKNYTYYKKNK